MYPINLNHSISLKEALARKSLEREDFKLHGLIGCLGFISFNVCRM